MKIDLAKIKLPEGLILTRGGRTGKKIHIAFAGSSGLACGIWVKARVEYFKVGSGIIDDSVLCENCFSRYKSNIEELRSDKEGNR